MRRIRNLRINIGRAIKKLKISCANLSYERRAFLIVFTIGVLGVLAGMLIRHKSESAEKIMWIKELHNGDAKFATDDLIVTSVDGYLCIYDLDSNVYEYTDVNSNWLDVILDGESVIILYSNDLNEIGIVKINDDMDITYQKVILQTDTLYIDPAIIKIDSNYYMTVTEIIGNVIISDDSLENGIYTIKLYMSDDLEQWDYVTDIVSAQNNLEDVKLFEKDSKLCVCYEKEILDKATSEILIMEATGDSFLDWSEPNVIVSDGNDNEPAGVLETKEGVYTLYFSSDAENPGQSYDGGNIYQISFDSRYQLLGNKKKIEADTRKGILLYDVKKQMIQYGF